MSSYVCIFSRRNGDERSHLFTVCGSDEDASALRMAHYSFLDEPNPKDIEAVHLFKLQESLHIPLAAWKEQAAEASGMLKQLGKLEDDVRAITLKLGLRVSKETL